jgi:hypothetical protein
MIKHEEMRAEVLKRYSEQDPFYVWFEDMEEGRKSEQERIIKLLEDECQGDWPKVIEMSLDNLKSLIKGEQK